MIVAVDDFNMGAMENKGLNIFNSRYVLASPETATDADYKSIETIIAHEYFHNWTGNRITCRDWFQLCLKEGLTVFRDQQFSADQRSAGVKRIEDVLRLRAAQFREDAGPLAHPVRPEEYIEINNFYTATVYEKGAEVIGMLRRLVGAGDLRPRARLYFERHDGAGLHHRGLARGLRGRLGPRPRAVQALVLPGRHAAAGATEDWDGARYRLDLAQETRPTPGQPTKAPLVIPVAYGLLDGEGARSPRGCWSSPSRASPSPGTCPPGPPPRCCAASPPRSSWSADDDPAERVFLLAHDSDPFNKWEAGRTSALILLAPHGHGPGRRAGRRSSRRWPRSRTTPRSTPRSGRWRSGCRRRRR